jgi:hypothetical protein
MRRRQLLHGGVAGLGAALAGCSAAADEADEPTNDLVLVNHMNVPAEFQLEAVGPTTRLLTYEVEPNTAHRITDYVDEGSYQLTVDNEIEVEAEDGGRETVARTAEGSWNPEACHTCKLRARRSAVEIVLEDCTTATASPTPSPTPGPTTDDATAGAGGTTGTGTGTGAD